MQNIIDSNIVLKLFPCMYFGLLLISNDKMVGAKSMLFMMVSVCLPDFMDLGNRTKTAF